MRHNVVLRFLERVGTWKVVGESHLQCLVALEFCFGAGQLGLQLAALGLSIGDVLKRPLLYLIYPAPSRVAGIQFGFVSQELRQGLVFFTRLGKSSSSPLCRLSAKLASLACCQLMACPITLLPTWQPCLP